MDGFYKSFKEFQDYYANKFQRSNPLPWQDGMQAIVWWITKNLPANTRATVSISNSPSGVTISGKGFDDDPYIWAFNFNVNDISDLSKIDLINVEKIDAAVVEADGIAFDASYEFLDANSGPLATKQGTIKLPIKAGANVTMTVNAQGVIEINAAGGGRKLYLHHVFYENTQNLRKYYLRFITSSIEAITSIVNISINISKFVYGYFYDDGDIYNSSIQRLYFMTPNDGHIYFDYNNSSGSGRYDELPEVEYTDTVTEL